MPTFNIDGDLVAEADATISVMDHGLLYGDGVFEGLRFYNGQIFRCAAHLERLSASADAIGLTIPMTDAALGRAMSETITASNQDNGYIRLIVTRGSGPLGINPATCKNPRVIIIVDQLALVPEEIVQQGAAVIIAKTRRLSANQLNPTIKSLNYLNNILARAEANKAGVEEAIMLNAEGRVAEGSADNVFIVHSGKLITPPISEGALAGITRAAILELAQKLGIECVETPLYPEDLYGADECFLTGTGAELIPVKRIDEVDLRPDRPTYARLQQAFKTLVATKPEAEDFYSESA